ncbi:MAG: SPOR domain-containing protein [Gammaproteobacteria bacterium]
MAAGFFFEGAGRRAALDAILAAADGEASVLCLTGPAGIGRTETLQHFLREADPGVLAVACITGDILMSAAQCCAALNEGLDQAAEGGDPCEALLGTFLRIRASGRAPVVLVDDADELGEETLSALREVCRSGAAALVLAGDTTLVTKSGSGSVVVMTPLDEEQCGAFAFAWAQQHQDSRRRPSRREVSRLHRKSGGIPGNLLPLLERSALVSQGGFRPGNILAGHLLFILAAVAALVWLLRDMGSDRSLALTSEIEVPVMLPGPSGDPSGAGSVALGGIAGAVVPQPVAVVSRPAPPARVVDMPGEDVPAAAVPPKVLLVPAPVEEPQPVPGRYSIDEQALQAVNPSRFTLQFFASFNEKGVRQFVTRHANKGMRSFRSVREGLPWYVAVGGNYRTKEDARNAVNGLPGELQELKPWPRSFQGIQDELRRRPD